MPDGGHENAIDLRLDETAVEHASLKKTIIDLSVPSGEDELFSARVKMPEEPVEKEILQQLHAAHGHVDPEQVSSREGGIRR